MKSIIVPLLLVFCCCQCYRYDVSYVEDIQLGEVISTKTHLIQSEEVSLEKEALSILEDGYVGMCNNQYYIAISISEAERLGYSPEAYDLLSYNLEMGNEMLKALVADWESDPTISSYSISDFTGREVEIVPVAHSLKSRSENVTLPSGILRASGQEVVETRQYFPHEARGILADCLCSGAQLGVNVVYTKVMDTVYSGSCIYKGVFTVSIAASGTNVTVAYQTTDSYGGTCSWEAYGN